MGFILVELRAGAVAVRFVIVIILVAVAALTLVGLRIGLLVITALLVRLILRR